MVILSRITRHYTCSYVFLKYDNLEIQNFFLSLITCDKNCHVSCVAD